MTNDDPMHPADFDFDDIFAILGAFSGADYSELDRMLDELADIPRCLRAVSPQAAISYGVLLTVPSLHTSPTRTQALIHLLVAHPQDKQPSSRALPS